MRIVADRKLDELVTLTLVQQIEKLRGSRVFCLYHDQRPDTDDGMDAMTVYLAKRMFQEVGKVKKLTVLLESPGGSVDHAYRLLKILRRNCEELEVLVVSWSKSAATFICLGADTIFMSDDAELGPLDVQIRDPKGGRRISALNAFKSLEFLREHLLETYETTVRFNVENYGMDLTHGIASSTPLISNMVNPLFGQVDLMELGQARRELAVGEEYSRRVMERYSYKDKDESTITQIVRHLVWNYPSHGFVIDAQEAKKLGLKVQDLDDECSELFNKIIMKVHSCIGIITQENQDMIDDFQKAVAVNAAKKATEDAEKDSNQIKEEEKKDNDEEQNEINGGEVVTPRQADNSKNGDKKDSGKINGKRAVDLA